MPHATCPMPHAGAAAAMSKQARACVYVCMCLHVRVFVCALSGFAAGAQS